MNERSDEEMHAVAVYFAQKTLEYFEDDPAEAIMALFGAALFITREHKQPDDALAKGLRVFLDTNPPGKWGRGHDA